MFLVSVIVVVSIASVVGVGEGVSVFGICGIVVGEGVGIGVVSVVVFVVNILVGNVGVVEYWYW